MFIQYIRAVKCIMFQFYICLSETFMFLHFLNCVLKYSIGKEEVAFIWPYMVIFYGILEYKYESINPVSGYPSVSPSL